MERRIRVIKGPVVPSVSREPESEIPRLVYSVWLDNGLMITNPYDYPDSGIESLQESEDRIEDQEQ
jgi:hypothetical protein